LVVFLLLEHIMKSSSLLLIVALSAMGACGNSKSATVDAKIIVVDAKPIDAAPDAFSCAAPTTDCSGMCVDTVTDSANCGACGTVCSGGRSCTTSACTCPASFAPATVTAGTNDQHLAQAGTDVSVTLFSDGANIDLALFGYKLTGTDATVLNRAYTLTGTMLGTAPFVALGYKFDLNAFLGTRMIKVAGAFYATAGTLTYTKACVQGAAGTLTNATFSGIKSLTPPLELDPNGCSFTVASMPFTTGKPDLCPAP
jgi:hypothetical protein